MNDAGETHSVTVEERIIVLDITPKLSG